MSTVPGSGPNTPPNWGRWSEDHQHHHHSQQHHHGEYVLVNGPEHSSPHHQSQQHAHSYPPQPQQHATLPHPQQLLPPPMYHMVPSQHPAYPSVAPATAALSMVPPSSSRLTPPTYSPPQSYTYPGYVGEQSQPQQHYAQLPHPNHHQHQHHHQDQQTYAAHDQSHAALKHDRSAVRMLSPKSIRSPSNARSPMLQPESPEAVPMSMPMSMNMHMNMSMPVAAMSLPVAMQPQQSHHYQHQQEEPVGQNHFADPISASGSRRTSASESSLVEDIPNINSKTVLPNVCLNPDHMVEFKTVVDDLMKAIQVPEKPVASFADAAPIGRAPIQMSSSVNSPVACSSPMSVNPAVGIHVYAMDSSPSSPSAGRIGKKSKSRTRHFCKVEGCNRSFGQKSHLDIHHRAHTGEKPYKCSAPGCDRRFSQLGNLRTHERLHSGDRPYTCDQCNKGFSARGKLKSHQAIHNGERRFVCKLEDCNKGFTQLGNLKAHQNKFHEATIKMLTDKFSKMSAGERANQADPDVKVWEYFATLYKNSNKGIKGRGKGRKVNVIRPPGTGSMHPPASMAGTSAPMAMTMGMNMASTTAPYHHQQNIAGPPQPGLPYDAVTAAHMRMSAARSMDGYSAVSSNPYEGHETRSMADPSLYEDERIRRMHY
ncbi:hypothetical protein BROUX41_005663 [Berkeleyomyces rouxiae]|uniref:uncharacterized protein n=1 Tax=Berkeleyomyces rouxiae TaxID=2035830 RepID=UPI003B80D108